MLPNRRFRPWLAALAVLTACSQALAEPPAVEPGIELELLEPGAAPRRALRFAPQKGAKQTLVMSMQMNQAMVVNGNTIPSPEMPHQKMTIEVVVTDVEPSGDIHLNYEYTKVEVIADEASQAFAPMLEARLKPLQGTRGSMVVSDRGYTLDSDITVTEETTPQMKQTLEGLQDSMQQMCSPMPEEEVGVGAKWKVTQNMVANGIAMTQKVTYQLKELTAQSAALELQLTQEADEQQVKPPGMPPGPQVTLKSLNSKGSGSMALSTDSVVPEKSEINVDSDIAMVILSGDREQPMEMKMSVTVLMAKPEADSKSR